MSVQRPFPTEGEDTEAHCLVYRDPTDRPVDWDAPLAPELSVPQQDVRSVEAGAPTDG